MPVFSKELVINTSGKGTYELTDQVALLVNESGISQGLAVVFNRHTSSSLILYENADPSARTDLEAYFDRMVPEEEPYFTHTLEGADDMPSHIRMVLTRSSETIPVRNGSLALGTWQGIFLFEHRSRPHRRTIVVTISGE